MKHIPSSTENGVEIARHCLETYGRDVARWPVDMRDAYGAYAELDGLSQARETAMLLDGFLGEATAPKLSHDLQNRIIAGIELPSTARAATGIFEFFASWKLVPTSVLAGVGACIGGLGLASGFMTANLQFDLQSEYVIAENESPEYEAYAYLEYSGDIFSDDQEEGTQ